MTRHRSTEAAIAKLPWTARLRAMGYKGNFEAGAMLRALSPKITVDVCEYELTLGALLSGPWMVRYQWFECYEREHEGDTPEEALGCLMLAHPELWQ